MARLVSIGVLWNPRRSGRSIDAGVHAAPNAADLVSGWLGEIKTLRNT